MFKVGERYWWAKDNPGYESVIEITNDFNDPWGRRYNAKALVIGKAIIWKNKNLCIDQYNSSKLTLLPNQNKL